MPTRGHLHRPSGQRATAATCLLSSFVACLPQRVPWCQLTGERQGGGLHVFHCSPRRPEEAPSRKVGWAGIRGSEPVASVKNRPALSLGAKGRGAQGESQDAFMAQARVLELLWPFFCSVLKTSWQSQYNHPRCGSSGSSGSETPGLEPRSLPGLTQRA